MKDIFLTAENSKKYTDFPTISGDALVEEALLRRLQTPINGYARWVRGPNGLQQVGTGYGNKVYSYLSDSILPVNVAAVRQAIADCAAQETRIRVTSVTASPDVTTSQINSTVNYQILESSNAQQVQVSVP